MKITFIGTGSGKVSMKRYHSSILISSDNYDLLIDAGDGISKALLKQKIKFNKINGILFSHFHPDHYAGFASLIVQMKMNNREDPLEIFVSQKSQMFLEDFLYNSFLFYEKLGFKIVYKNIKNNTELFLSDDFSFISRANSHLDDYRKYDSQNLLSFSSWSFLIKLNGNNIFYTGDMGNKKDLKLFSDFNMDYFISEITHIELEEIIELGFSNKCKIILTHISEEDESKLSKLFAGLSTEKRTKIIAADDGLSINL